MNQYITIFKFNLCLHHKNLTDYLFSLLKSALVWF